MAVYNWPGYKHVPISDCLLVRRFMSSTFKWTFDGHLMKMISLSTIIKHWKSSSPFATVKCWTVNSFISSKFRLKGPACFKHYMSNKHYSTLFFQMDNQIIEYLQRKIKNYTIKNGVYHLARSYNSMVNKQCVNLKILAFIHILKKIFIYRTLKIISLIWIYKK